MDTEKYITERLDDQIDWYSSKSQWNQKWFRRCQILQIISASSIPFLTGYISNSNSEIKFIVGFLGLFIAVLSGLIALNKYQELWIEYRSTAESLKHQKYLFITKSKPYQGEDAFNILVETVEWLISKEHSKWAGNSKSKLKEGTNG